MKSPRKPPARAPSATGKPASSAPELTKLVGRRVTDAAVKRALGEWGVKLPPPVWDDGLEEWEGFFQAKVPALGLELTVNLADERKKASRQLYAVRVGSKFAGVLPHGLAFGERQADARKKLGPFSAPDKRYNALEGDTFRIKGTRLYGVAIYGPTKRLAKFEVNAFR